MLSERCSALTLRFPKCLPQIPFLLKCFKSIEHSINTVFVHTVLLGFDHAELHPYNIGRRAGLWRCCPTHLSNGTDTMSYKPTHINDCSTDLYWPDGSFVSFSYIRFRRSLIQWNSSGLPRYFLTTSPPKSWISRPSVMIPTRSSSE